MVCKGKWNIFLLGILNSEYGISDDNLNENGQSNLEEIASPNLGRFLEVLHVGDEQLPAALVALRPVGVVDVVGQLMGIDGDLVAEVAGQEYLEHHDTEELQHRYELARIGADAHVLQAIAAEADDEGAQHDLGENVGRD